LRKGGHYVQDDRCTDDAGNCELSRA
jgi:hypothetical protein